MMAGPITIPITRDTNYLVGDRIQIEIDGQVQPDIIYMWLDDLSRDAAVAGESVQSLIHETLASFSAGDYDVRLRGIDEVGNEGGWSAVTSIEHRPTPAAPEGLEVSAGLLTGTWQDL